MTLIVPSTLAQYGIAQMRFGGLMAEDIRAYRDDVLHGIQEVGWRKCANSGADWRCL